MGVAGVVHVDRLVECVAQHASELLFLSIDCSMPYLATTRPGLHH